MKRGSAPLLLVLFTLSCAPTLPAAYVRARSAAEQAYSAGRYAQAAVLWLGAASQARNARDRNEARFRAAASYARAGQSGEAAALYAQIAVGSSERAARASFALAYLHIEEHEPAGFAELEAAIFRHPSSGVAAHALLLFLAHVEDEHGSASTLAYIERVLPALDRSPLAGQLLYARAQKLEALGETSRARDAYLALADRFPYPHGAYWDDALFFAARCQEKLGRPEQAIATLERLLAEREFAHMQGSYERVRYAEAAFHIAELYRDALGKPLRARQAFRQVFTDFPTSLLRDDALWAEALLAHSMQDRAATCQPLVLLLKDLPDSRYAGCTDRLCAGLKTPPEKRCPAYLERSLPAAATAAARD